MFAFESDPSDRVVHSRNTVATRGRGATGDGTYAKRGAVHKGVLSMASLVHDRVLMAGFALCMAVACKGTPEANSANPPGPERPNPDPVPSPYPVGSCGLDQPAFCDTFETPQAGGRGGELDESRWSFSRYSHMDVQFFVRIPASTLSDVVYPPVFCGEPFSNLLPGNDVALCDGVGVNGQASRQLNEVFHDIGGFGFNSARIRQPFDFTNRTGTLVFDVDAKINPHNVGHGWWIEFWLTEDPAPMPYHESPTVIAYPRNGIGFAFRGFGTCGKADWLNQLETVFVSRNYQIYREYAGDWDVDHDTWEGRCFKTADRQLNRFKLLISKERAELWVSDYDDPLNLRRVASVPDLDLNFTRGYVHLQHSHYNARKDGNVTPAQTYRWDNVAFDGPHYPTPRAYDIPDQNVTAARPDGILTGYYLRASDTVRVTAPAVDLTSALAAIFNFNLKASVGRTLEYRFNEREWRAFRIPDFGPGADWNGLRSFSVDVPLADLMPGDNVIDLRMTPGGEEHEVIGNMDVMIEVSG
jgi:hypothetical protein